MKYVIDEKSIETMEMPKVFFDLAPKPSALIRLMTHSLRNNETNIVLDMSTFGGWKHSSHEESKCLACAATITAFSMMKKKIKDFDLMGTTGRRAQTLGVGRKSLNVFESIVDGLRLGGNVAVTIVEAYAIACVNSSGEVTDRGYKRENFVGLRSSLPILNTNYDDSELDDYDEYAEKLEALGL